MGFVWASGYHGVYHQMSPKHLQRYVNEFTFRVTRRLKSMQSVVTEVLDNVTDGQHLSYNELIEKPI